MIVLIRGAGDLSTGVALRLFRSGLKVVMTEIPQPLAVRRKVAFAEAIYTGEAAVEGVTARRVTDAMDTLRILTVLAKSQIPVVVDPDGQAIRLLHPGVLVDGRMLKRPTELPTERISLVIGLGPGFVAGGNCHAAIETNRGHYLGRVVWEGATQDDTSIPDAVLERQAERVLRAPTKGVLTALAEIGDHLELGQPVAEVGGQQVVAPFKGVLRGLLYPGISVSTGVKIGDMDPRDDPKFCWLVSDKSLAVGGGVLEAILSRPELRKGLWG